MKMKEQETQNQPNGISTLLVAVTPTPKLSTDGIALDSAAVSRGNGMGATTQRKKLAANERWLLKLGEI